MQTIMSSYVLVGVFGPNLIVPGMNFALSLGISVVGYREAVY